MRVHKTLQFSAIKHNTRVNKKVLLWFLSMRLQRMQSVLYCFATHATTGATD